MKRCLLVAVSICVLCFLNACGGGANGTTNGGGGGGVGPQVATHFTVTAPATAGVNTFFNVTLVALDSSNSAVLQYSGTVHFTSSDPHAVLPSDTTLTSGIPTLPASLSTIGNQTITATDTVTAGITGNSNSIAVANDANLHGFQSTGSMGTARAAHTATLLADGRVLIAGGFNDSAVLTSAELFDPATGTFTPTGAMTTARFSHTATLLANGKVLVTGGSDLLADLASHDSHTTTLLPKEKVRTGASDNSGDVATAELFDPATGTFTLTGAMSEPRSDHTATLLADGKVLVAGGAPDNVTELYDPATGTFTATTGQLIVGGRWGCTATLLSDGTVLVAGGRDDENVFDAFPLNDAEVFNPATGTFTATGTMTEFRYSHAAALLNTGQVLLTGGFNGQPVRDAELFDPKTGSFTATGLMVSIRAMHTATLLPDGTVLVVGGFTFFTPSQSFSTSEIFDPTTNMFASAGPMPVARFLHTATRLNNGQVLVTGGISNASPPQVIANSANLFK